MRRNTIGPAETDVATTRRSSRLRVLWTLAAPLAILLTATRAAPDEATTYEPLPTLKASDFLDASWLKGNGYEVEQNVVTDGVFNTYTLRTPYGDFHSQGTALTLVRLQEIDAIAQLQDVDKIGVASGAAIETVVNLGKNTVHVVTNPVEAAQGIGGAAARLFGRIGRSAKRTKERIDSGGGTGKDGKTTSTGERVADASGKVAKDLLGVNRALRSWAQKLAVDPYTHNQVLRDELETVANYDAGGRFSTKLLPLGVVGTVLGSATTVNKLIWMKEPDELLTLNETRLEAMGVSPEDSRAFRLNKNYTLAVQVRLVASLDTLSNVTGRPEFVAQAAGAETEADTRFFQESAGMAEIFNRTEAPLLGILPDVPGAVVIAKGDRLVCLYPIDYLVWTEAVAGYVARITEHAQKQYPDARRELWMTGSVSARSATELKDRGWTVHEKAMTELRALPARTEGEAPPTNTDSN